MTAPSITAAHPQSVASPSRPTWRRGLAAGLVAAAATTAIAAAATGFGVSSLETEPGEAIPVLGFGQLTLFFTVVGIVMARAMARWARHPRTMFVRTTVVLTALSIVPDLVLQTDAATKITLIVTHLVAAAIVIPALSARLDESGSEAA